MINQPLTFENFDWSIVKLKDHRGNPVKKEAIMGFTSSMYQRLILFGETGRGKTHLAKAHLNAYQKQRRKEVEEQKIPTWESDGMKFTDFIKTTDTEQESRKGLYEIFFDMEPHQEPEIKQRANYDFRMLMRAELLVIDDLGSEKKTEKEVFLQGFLKLLDQYTNKLIITTNLAAKIIRECYKDKIYSRLYQDALIVGIDGPDYRLRGL